MVKLYNPFKQSWIQIEQLFNEISRILFIKKKNEKSLLSLSLWPYMHGIVFIYTYIQKVLGMKCMKKNVV